MMTLRDTVYIDVPPEDVFEWFRGLEKNYSGWHADHVRWEFKDGFREGSRCYCEEFIHGKLHKMNGRITGLRENRLVEFRFSFPTSLVCPGGSFAVEPEKGGSTFEATLSFRFARAFSRLAKRRMSSVRDHMREEGQNLKTILEERCRAAYSSSADGTAKSGCDERRQDD